MGAFDGNGLYGQNDSDRSSQVASAEFIADQQPTQAGRRRRRLDRFEVDSYLMVLGRLFALEMQVDREQRRLDVVTNDEFDEIVDMTGNMDDVLANFLMRNRDIASDVHRARLQTILARTARILNMMHRIGCDGEVVHATYRRIISRAMHYRREKWLDERGILEKADKPRSRVGRSCSVYRIPENTPKTAPLASMANRMRRR